MNSTNKRLWQCLADARLAIEEAEHLLTELENKVPDAAFLLKDYGVYVYRDPELKRSDPNSIVYVGNGKGDRPWQPHSNAIANDFEMDSRIEVLCDGMTGPAAESLEYALIKKYKPKYNLVLDEPGIKPKTSAAGPWRVCAYKNLQCVGMTNKVNTSIGNVEALYASSYGNKYSSGGSPFPNLESGVDYDSVRIRIGD